MAGRPVVSAVRSTQHRFWERRGVALGEMTTEGQDNGNRSSSACCLSSTQESADARMCRGFLGCEEHVRDRSPSAQNGIHPLAILYTTKTKSARKCHRREDAHRVVGWECANSGLVERGPWPLVTRQEFLTRGEGGIAYSPRIGLCRKGMEERRQARYQGMPW